MTKEHVLSQLYSQGVIAVVRGQTCEDGIRIAEACIDGGVKAIELAFTTPRAQEAIRVLSEKYESDADVIIGAGTVLEAISARIAILEGAKFIVSPSFDAETIRICNLYRTVSCPGVMTPEGVTEALSAGADIVKIFPGDILGTRMIKDLHGPFPHANLMPSGGVDAGNVAEWLSAGCIAVSAGSSLTGTAKKGDYSGITNKAREFVSAVRDARGAKGN